MPRALELYCGIGGFAEASKDLNISIEYAFDQNENALAVYNANFSKKAQKFNLEKFDADMLDSLNIDFLWMSPPCQPYTIKGNRKDIEDSRSKSFLKVIEAIFTCKQPPVYIGLENVEYFKNSKARELFVEGLKERGYFIDEVLLCPMEDLGIPNRRLRYYLCASLKPLKELNLKKRVRKLKDFTIESDNPYAVPKEVLQKFSKGFRIVDINDPLSYTTCFTSSYSKSWMHSGAYLRDKKRVRLFEPKEIALLLGFGEEFVLPKELSKKNLYKLLGNSLSVFALKEVLLKFDI